MKIHEYEIDREELIGKKIRVWVREFRMDW